MTQAASTNPTSFPQSSRRGGWRLLVLVLLALGLAVAGWRWVKPGGAGHGAAEASQPADDWHVAGLRSFDISVVASGELQARNQREVRCALEGVSTIVWIAAEGSRVKQGEDLVRLADDQIKDKIEEEQITVEKARESAESAAQNLAIEESEAQSALDAAQVTVDLAALDIRKWESGEVHKKSLDLQLAIEKATRNLARARDNLTLSKQLYAEEFISKAELEDDELKLIEAEEALKSAKLDVEIYDSYTKPREKRKFESDLSQAKAALERTKGKNASKVAKAKVAVEAAQRELALRQSRMDKLKEQLANTVLKAPQDGLVVYASTIDRNKSYRSDPLAQGATVKFNETLIYLPDTESMGAGLRVHESLLRQVQVGQGVRLTVDARPGKVLTGKVSSIGVMAEESSRWFNPNLREYMVRVDLEENSDPGLKPGMRCSGDILLGRIENNLAVPVQAVISEGKSKFVYVPEGEGRVKRQPVEVGRSSDTLVVIKSGLSEGERVLLRRPRPGELSDEHEPEGTLAKAQGSVEPAGEPSENHEDKQGNAPAKGHRRSRPSPGSEPAVDSLPVEPSPAPVAPATPATGESKTAGPRPRKARPAAN